MGVVAVETSPDVTGDLAGEMTPFKLYEDLLGTELRLTSETLSGVAR